MTARAVLLGILLLPAPALKGGTLQDRIRAAAPGDTIVLRGGVYEENLLIDRRIVLIGVDDPVIRGTGRGSAVTVTAELMHHRRPPRRTVMTGEFDPAQYRDEYREAVRAVIEAKIEGHEAVAAPEAETGGKLIDLMAALEASVKAASAARAAAEPAPVSVAQTKQAKAGRAGKAAATDAAQKAEVTPEADAEAGAPRPVRKRKTA